MPDVYVALDVPSVDDALGLVDRLGADATRYKVGPELFARGGPDVVRALVNRGKHVFLDLKLHDIPNTVAGAVDAVADLGVELTTVHATGGLAMLAAAREAAGERVRVLAVTVLTSLDSPGLTAVWGRRVDSMEDEVERLVGLAREALVDGFVASVWEAGRIRREAGAEALIVTPGIRPAGADRGDQSRVATPTQAVEAGADALVVGRAVTRAGDPAAALAEIEAEVAAARRTP